MHNTNTYTNIYDRISSDEEIFFSNIHVVRAIKDIDVHKGSGIDFLTTFILKDCFEVLTIQLAYLFNQSMSLGIFPESWKVATVTPIPKAGNRILVNNFRDLYLLYP